jgi:phosphoribosylaminoimidazole-succinocarboxamide synthase
MTTTAPASATPDYEGKAKRLFTEGENLRVEFKDEATAFNGVKHAVINGKGQLNAAISAKLFAFLQQAGLPTCFIQQGEVPDTLIYEKLTMIPLEVVVRNMALGSFAKRYGVAEGTVLNTPLMETFLKRDDLNDPLIPASAVNELGLIPKGLCINALERFALSANTVLTAVFNNCGITCADFKLEFGLTADGKLRIGDEMSPDNFRLRDSQTGQILDKDTFRLEEGDITERYQIVLDRLNAMAKLPELAKQPYQVDVIVTSRPNVLSPESRTLTEQLKLNGFEDTQTVMANKQFAVTINAIHAQAAYKQAFKMSKAVLANPVVEDAHIAPTVLPA